MNAEDLLKQTLLTLNSKSKSEIVASEIIRRIQCGIFKPEDCLPSEKELGQELGVGRSTLREAVKQLVSQNILEIKRGRGTFIAKHPGVQPDPFGFRFLNDKVKLGIELCEIRLMIEPTLAKNAALRADCKQRLSIVEAQEQVRLYVGKGLHHEKQDILFHKAIAACTKNSILNAMFQVIISGIPYLISITNRRLCEQAVRTHQMVVDAILQKDGDAAFEAMSLHIQQNKDDLEACLKQTDKTRKAEDVL